MSQMVVIECDASVGNNGCCLNRHEGFTIHVSESKKRRILENNGWRCKPNGDHYCPQHKRELQ